MDLSKNIALKELICQDNDLTSLDLSNNIALEYRQCSSNLLTHLDVTQNTSLTSLACVFNQLTSLDISKNKNLTMLYFGNNLITSLDVSNLVDLNFFSCVSSPLNSLDLSKNVALIRMSCFDNPNLSTICVPSIADAEANPNFQKDFSANWAEGCSKKPQTISPITNITKLYNSAPFALTATATSGLAVSYTSSNTNIVSFAGNTATIKAAGTSTITASQPGDANYLAAPNVTFTITVQNPVITASGVTTFCQGGKVSLRAPKGLTSYSWTGGTTKDSLVVTAGGTYKVIINGKDTSNAITLTVNTVPAVSITSLSALVNANGGKITLTGTPIGVTFSGLGVTANLLDPKVGKLGISTVNYAAANQCGVGSKSQKTIVYDTLGLACSVKDTLYITSVITSVNNALLENTLKIYPNPASDFLIIDNGNFAVMNGYSVQVYNVSGVSVFNAPITQAQFSINLSSWTKNTIYIVKLLNAQGTVTETRKVIVQ